MTERKLNGGRKMETSMDALNEWREVCIWKV